MECFPSNDQNFKNDFAFHGPFTFGTSYLIIEGLPLLTSNYTYKGYPTKVYSYAKNQFVFKSEKGFPYITLADINGNGLKEIIPSATTYDGYYLRWLLLQWAINITNKGDKIAF